MFERSVLLALATAGLLVLAAPVVRANPPLDQPDEGKDKAGGNAIDQAASGVTTDELPDDYEIAAYFWAFALGLDPEDLADSEFDTLEEALAYQLSIGERLRRGEPLVVVGSIRTSEPLAPAPAAAPEQPIDGPAESVLDQIDESQAQLPMVGELGTTSAATGAAPAATPPPESILDYLDSAPQPAATQDATKPAANQAAPVRVAE